jgi:hypothetical protein
MDNIVSLAQTDKLHIKSITEAELEAVNTAAEYMLDKDDYKAAARRKIVRANHFIGSIYIRYIHVLKHIIH